MLQLAQQAQSAVISTETNTRKSRVIVKQPSSTVKRSTNKLYKSTSRTSLNSVSSNLSAKSSKTPRQVVKKWQT